MSDTNKGRIPIPTSILKERREMAVDLRSIGLSMRTVLKEINKLSVSKKWGVISMRTLERDISQYYETRNVLDEEDKRNVQGLRKAHIAQMETVIEDSLMLIHKNKYLSPPEKINIYEKAFKMQSGLAEIQGWNISKNRESAVKDKGFVVAPVEYPDSGFISSEMLKLPRDEMMKLAHLMQDKEYVKKLAEKYRSGLYHLNEGEYLEENEDENCAQD